MDIADFVELSESTILGLLYSFAVSENFPDTSSKAAKTPAAELLIVLITEEMVSVLENLSSLPLIVKRNVSALPSAGGVPTLLYSANPPSVVESVAVFGGVVLESVTMGPSGCMLALVASWVTTTFIGTSDASPVAWAIRAPVLPETDAERVVNAIDLLKVSVNLFCLKSNNLLFISR
ncbi:hypothetical protein D3C85_1292960 [compost metagenome]